ncbi:MAG: hypothetical protein LBE38_09960 [Deltaproteobacteria bacterium]|jgi:F0F1-type ATP synthase epsilon subunit|nr:hypothetical protein [Deltaproteobacteria bacterium]
MSDKPFKFTLVSPNGALVEGADAIAVNVVGSQGTFNARPGHEPFLTDTKVFFEYKDGQRLDRGIEVWYRTPAGEEITYYVCKGYVEVLPDRVTVLAEDAYLASEVTEEEERERQKEILKQLEDAGKLPEGARGAIEINDLEIQLQKSVARLNYAKSKKGKNI